MQCMYFEYRMYFWYTSFTVLKSFKHTKTWWKPDQAKSGSSVYLRLLRWGREPPDAMSLRYGDTSLPDLQCRLSLQYADTSLPDLQCRLSLQYADTSLPDLICRSSLRNEEQLWEARVCIVEAHGVQVFPPISGTHRNLGFVW